MKLCECGCGISIPNINKKGKPAKFAHGHNNRDIVWPKEIRDKVSFSLRGWYKQNKNSLQYKNRLIKIGNGNRGKVVSDTTKEKLKGRIPWNKGVIGFMAGEQNSNWKGGKALMKGYWFIRVATGNYKKLSRINMEKHLRRNLSSNDIVHHVNGDKTDDRIENLQLMTRKEHINLHHH